MKNKIFLFPLSLAVIFFASFIIIFSPVGKKNIIKVSQPLIEWKTYTNDQYGFEFQYPMNLIINTESNKIIISDPLEKYSKAIIDLEQFNNISYPASKWLKGKSPSLVCIDQNCPVEYEVSNVNLSNNLESTLIEYDFGFSFEKNYLIYSPKTGYLSFHYGSNEDLVNQENKIINTYTKILSTFKFLPDTTDWKTYTNDQYGFEFQYPSEYSLSSNELSTRVGLFSPPEKIINLKIVNKNKMNLEAFYKNLPTLCETDNDFCDTEQPYPYENNQLRPYYQYSSDKQFAQLLTGTLEPFFKLYAFSSGEYIYQFIVTLNTPEEDFNQILSTFEFIK